MHSSCDSDQACIGRHAAQHTCPHERIQTTTEPTSNSHAAALALLFSHSFFARSKRRQESRRNLVRAGLAVHAHNVSAAAPYKWPCHQPGPARPLTFLATTSNPELPAAAWCHTCHIAIGREGRLIARHLLDVHRNVRFCIRLIRPIKFAVYLINA